MIARQPSQLTSACPDFGAPVRMGRRWYPAAWCPTAIVGVGLAALALLGAACTSSRPEDGLAYTADSESPSDSASQSESPSDSEPDQNRDQSSNRFLGPPSPAQGDEEDGEAIPEATTSTTLGSGLAPVTTVDLPIIDHPESDYRGILGNTALSQSVAVPAAVPPGSVVNVAPLTGQPGIVPDRPAVVAKLENAADGGQLTGVMAADIVVEEDIRSGTTTLTALFHSHSSIVGPIGRARTTDLAVIGGLGSPVLLHGGTDPATAAILSGHGRLQDHGYDRSSGYWRADRSSATVGLLSDTAPHWASASGQVPPPQFDYLDGNEVAPGSAVDKIELAYTDLTVRWQWDETQWLRWQDGVRHRVASGQQIAAANVILIEVVRVSTGVDASPDRSDESLFVGDGVATVFTGGRRTDGIWTRPTLSSVATLTDDGGNTIELTPGPTWIHLIDRDRTD